MLMMLQKKYTLIQISFSDMDENAQSAFFIAARDTQNWKSIEFFSLAKDAETNRFFETVKKSYGENTGVYIFMAGDQLFSNCKELEIEMFILQGISSEDILNKTPQYFNYLFHFQLFEKITHISWESNQAAKDN